MNHKGKGWWNSFWDDESPRKIKRNFKKSARQKIKQDTLKSIQEDLDQDLKDILDLAD